MFRVRVAMSRIHEQLGNVIRRGGNKMKKVLSLTLVLTLVAAMNMVTGIASAADGDDDWPMFHHDLALSGVSDSTAPTDNTTAWIYDTGSVIESSPAVVDGILYIGSQSGVLYALNISDGSEAWTYPSGSSIQSSPAVANGNVYFLNESGNLISLDANTGALNWSQPVGNGSWDWSSPAVHGGNVFIGTSDGYVHSLATSDGSNNWSTPVGGTPDSPIAVVNGKVYSGTHNFNNSAPTLVALNESDGSVNWTYDYYLYHGGVVGMINSNSVAVVDGDGDNDLEVYFGVYNWQGTDNQSVCLDEATGTEVWTANIHGNSTSTPAVHAGKVFVGSDDGKLYALDAATGAQIWTYQTGAEVWAAPAVADGMVFFGSLDHTFYAVDEGDGSLVWSYYTGASRLRGSPAVADGMVFTGNENGNVYAFGEPVVEVGIDIKPGSFPNSINPGSKGVIPVAILTTVDFDASDVDAETVLFGPTGTEASPVHYALEDVDNDGDIDMILHFRAQDTGIAEGDTEAILTGQTLGGKPITGTDSVRIVPSKGKKK